MHFQLTRTVWKCFLCFQDSLRCTVYTTNVPSNFLKSVCAKNFLCETLCQHSSEFRTTYMKYVQKHFGKEHLWSLQVFLRVLIWRPVCVRTCAQLRGNIVYYP